MPKTCLAGQQRAQGAWAPACQLENTRARPGREEAHLAHTRVDEGALPAPDLPVVLCESVAAQDRADGVAKLALHLVRVLVAEAFLNPGSQDILTR